MEDCSNGQETVIFLEKNVMGIKTEQEQPWQCRKQTNNNVVKVTLCINDGNGSSITICKSHPKGNQSEHQNGRLQSTKSTTIHGLQLGMKPGISGSNALPDTE